MNSEGITGTVGDDTGPAPPADKEVQPFGSVAAELAAVTKGQVVDVVYTDQMTCIEVRASAACPEVLQITYQSGTGAGIGHVVVGDVREVVDRVRIGVIEVKLQTMGNALAECKQQSVVVGTGVVANVAVCASLSREAHVRCQESTLRQQQNDAGEIALLHKLV